MSNLLEQTEVNTKSKRLDRNSGKLPSKARFTPATFISLKKNIDLKSIEKAIEKLNTVYSELMSAAAIAEKVKAEEEVRNKIQGNAELDAKIEQDDKIAKMTSSDIINKKIKKASIELLKLAGRIGTYKDHYGINAKKGFNSKSAKALNVQKLYADVYKSIQSKIDLYALAEKNKKVKNDSSENNYEEDSVPKWKKLFDGIKKVPSNLTIAINDTKNKEEEEKEFVAPVKGVSPEDISYRKMLGQLGDEFETIENYEKSPSGIPMQFKDGFESRKNNLSKILIDLTGIEPKEGKKKEIEIKDNTEFQNYIDEVTGYKEKMSDEEHKKMEESLNEYYNSEEVSSKISELNEKDVLYTFNQHMDDIIKNESLLNKTNAENKIEQSNEEVKVSNELLEKQKEEYELKQGAEEQARMLKSLYNYIDMRDKFEEEQRQREEQERKELLKGAEEQASLLFDNNLILDGAEEQAKMIVNEEIREQQDKENMNKMIANGAKAEAQRMIDEALIPESAEIEAKNILNREINAQQEKENIENIIKNGAEAEAQRMIDEALIPESAEIEAKNILNREIYAQQEKENIEKMIKNGSMFEAQRMIDEALIPESAEIEARRIIGSIEKEKNEIAKINSMIKDGAEAEAQRMIDEALIPESAAIEAQRIHDGLFIVNGADEQAKMLQKQNEYADILESAEVQAKILQNKYRKAKLLQDAENLAEQLKSINEETSKIDSLIGKMVDSDVLNDIHNKEKVQDKPEVADTMIVDSAKEEAKRIHEKNIIVQSAEEEARKLYDKNSLIDSAREEAQKIFDRDIITQSAEEEARKLYDNNVIAQSAEEEAQKIMNASKVEQKVEQKEETVKPVSNVSDNGFKIIDINDRYAELTNKSNALLVKGSRIENINKRLNPTKNSTNSKKQQLQLLKEELENENYSFLNNSEEVMRKAA